MTTARVAIPALVLMVLLWSGVAGAEEPDRSALSYEDNVTINTACFAAHKKGVGPYETCLTAQVAALKTHPAPDRSKVSAAASQAMERDCANLRRNGVADYNDCLRKDAEPPGTAGHATEESGFAPRIAEVFAAVPEEKMRPVAATARLRRPDEVLTVPARPAGHETLSPAELYKKVARSVFVVYAAPSIADARAGSIMQGSAVAVSEHLLLTNCHVVADRPVIRLQQGGVTRGATLAAGDPAADRCVITSPGAPLAPVAGVRPYADLEVGERVFAVGTPHGLERTLSEGLISGLRQEKVRHLVQTSAPISPGSSGGGLFDERGNLIGITNEHYREPGMQNLDFAIAASDYWN